MLLLLRDAPLPGLHSVLMIMRLNGFAVAGRLLREQKGSAVELYV